MATLAITGELITIKFDDGRTTTATAVNLAVHVPLGRWQTKVHRDPHPFVPKYVFVLRAPDGTLEFAAWSGIDPTRFDISPLAAMYEGDDCAFPQGCGDYATKSLTVTSTAGAPIVLPVLTAGTIGRWRVFNGFSSSPLPEQTCSEQVPSIHGYVTRL